MSQKSRTICVTWAIHDRVGRPKSGRYHFVITMSSFSVPGYGVLPESF